MNHPNQPLLELIAIGVRHIDDVPTLRRRADILTAAANACHRAGDEQHAEQLRVAAADLRRADETQLRLNEHFTGFAAE